MAQKSDDLQKIKQLIEIMKENELVEVEVKHGDDKILLKRSQPGTASPAPVQIVSSLQSPLQRTGDMNQTEQGQPADANQDTDQGLVEIKSSIVGTFYAGPSPDSENFVEIGSEIGAQTVVCIIEAMKVMNEIKAQTSGTIAKILVENGQAVEYGQVLFKVKPN